MNIKEIKELIDKVNESGLTEFVYETETENLVIKKEQKVVNMVEAPVSQVIRMPGDQDTRVSSPVTSASVTAEVKVETPVVTGHIIKSPIVGTFYGSSNPTAEPFVKVGDKVKKGQVICIVEAMKLMNEIESDVSGEVIEILAQNGQMVEYDQPLYVVK